MLNVVPLQIISNCIILLILSSALPVMSRALGECMCVCVCVSGHACVQLYSVFVCVSVCMRTCTYILECQAA